MKKQLLSVLAVMILLVTAFAAPVAQAAKPPTSPLDHGPIKNQYSGDSASLSLYSTVDGCIYSNVSLMASTQTVKSRAGGTITGQYASIYIDRYDYCNGLYLASLSGYAEIDGSSYQIDRQLNSAHLQTVIAVYDWYSGAESSISVDVSWSGTGDVQKGRSRYTFQSPGCKTSYSWSGSSRMATVSGSINDGATEYLTADSVLALLQSVKAGDMTLGCGM